MAVAVKLLPIVLHFVNININNTAATMIMMTTMHHESLFAESE